jgi:succinate-semialdehyde dehydrogenase / glutarate-semialdehyde dehydrogenase
MKLKKEILTMKPLIKNKQLIRTQALIDGDWIDESKGKSFSVYNPYDSSEIAKVPNLGKKETIQAIEAADWAFGGWSSSLAKNRAQKLFHLSELIKQNIEDLSLLITLEQGKPLHESKSEVLFSADVIRWSAEEACRVHGLTQCDPDEELSALTIRQPIGVIGVISPWNFPFAIPTQKVFSALAAGCTVVLKPAEATPLSALALAYLCQEAEIPPGVINVVTCEKPNEVGEILATHPLISKVTFTGSTEVGKKILEMGASTVKKVTLELGGNCPFIVFEDADFEKAFQGIFNLKFFNAGQCCNSINRVLVQQSIYDSFIKNCIEMTKNLTVGSGLETVDMGPLINREAKKKIEDLVKDASQKGAEVFSSKKKQKGLLCPPIVIKNARSDMRIFSEEIFGPILAFYSFDTEDEAIAIANDTRYGLASYFYTENLSRAMRVAKALEAGTVGINTINTFSMTLPFGGWKESGIGREGGIVGSLDEYCELKAISIGN